MKKGSKYFKKSFIIMEDETCDVRRNEKVNGKIEWVYEEKEEIELNSRKWCRIRKKKNIKDWEKENNMNDKSKRR